MLCYAWNAIIFNNKCPTMFYLLFFVYWCPLLMFHLWVLYIKKERNRNYKSGSTWQHCRVNSSSPLVLINVFSYTTCTFCSFGLVTRTMHYNSVMAKVQICLGSTVRRQGRIFIFLRSGNSATTSGHVLTGSHSLLRMTITLFPGFYKKLKLIPLWLIGVSGVSLCLRWWKITYY